MEFYRYFLPNTKINLENVSYETVKNGNETKQYKMTCKDTILAQLMGNGVKINFNRKVDFEPEALFVISVTFSVFLPFKDGAKDELDWKNMDIAGEFKKAGGPILTTLMSKTSLLIGEITASAGQNPLITPVNVNK